METILEINKGSSIVLPIEWTDENNAPINITGFKLSIYEAEPSFIKEHGYFKVTNAAQGKFTFLVNKEWANDLKLGKSANFRIALLSPDGIVQTTDLVTIKIV